MAGCWDAVVSKHANGERSSFSPIDEDQDILCFAKVTKPAQPITVGIFKKKSQSETSKSIFPQHQLVVTQQRLTPRAIQTVVWIRLVVMGIVGSVLARILFLGFGPSGTIVTGRTCLGDVTFAAWSRL